jgi:threonine dehydrogenase-like Zn-dependent dehydrogenase
MGATVVADPRERSLSELASQLPLGGVEVAVDAVGLTQTRRDAIGAVAAGGRVVLLGLEEEDSEISFADVIRREVTLVGSFAYTAAEFHQAAEILGDLEDFLRLVEMEPLERGAEVFARLADRQEQRVKVVLAP